MSNQKLIFKRIRLLLCFHFFLITTSQVHADHQCAKALHFHTETPIKYVVVIIPEDVSFDHYFATYPKALNPPGEPLFKAKRNTPTINGLNRPLLAHNTNAVSPFRLNHEEIICIPDHVYTPLQQDEHAGLMDQFVEVNPTCQPIVMGYFDGNTVTAIWNYAQRFAMSDNCFATTNTPSTPGHINIISGQTHGVEPPNLTIDGEIISIDGTLISSSVNPAFDKCKDT